MTNPVTKARDVLEALDGAEARTGEHFSKMKDEADDAYMARVEQIAKERGVSTLEAHRIASADPVAADAYERSARIADEHAQQADTVRGIASRVQE
jgi:hypothetical protein